MTNTEHKGLFLDRDGVINVDYAYIHTPEKFVFIDGIFELCRAAQAKGYQIFVVTNQSGIGRGYYTQAQFLELTDWMLERFKEEGVSIGKVYYCPDHPEHGIGEYKRDSEMRKPGAGMILNAKRDYGIDLSRSLLIGDKESDIQAARTAGIPKALLFSSDAHINDEQATNRIRSLGEAISFL